MILIFAIGILYKIKLIKSGFYINYFQLTLLPTISIIVPTTFDVGQFRRRGEENAFSPLPSANIQHYKNEKEQQK
jgi:hypothetical protein